MSKKKINILLLVLTISVYGAITYKYFGGGNPIPENTNNTLPTSETMPKIAEDTQAVFQLKINDRDPFLDRTYSARLSQQRQVSSIPSTRSSTQSKQPKLWPDINYLGFTKSNAQNKRMAILRINGKLYRKRQGTIIEGLKITAVYNDSIQVQFNKEKRYFSRD